MHKDKRTGIRTEAIIDLSGKTEEVKEKGNFWLSVFPFRYRDKCEITAKR